MLNCLDIKENDEFALDFQKFKGLRNVEEEL